MTFKDEQTPLNRFENKPHNFSQLEQLFPCNHHFSCNEKTSNKQEIQVVLSKDFETYPASNAPATSAEIKNGEFAKTSLVQTNMPVSIF